MRLNAYAGVAPLGLARAPGLRRPPSPWRPLWPTATPLGARRGRPPAPSRKVWARWRGGVAEERARRSGKESAISPRAVCRGAAGERGGRAACEARCSSAPRAERAPRVSRKARGTGARSPRAPLGAFSGPPEPPPRPRRRSEGAAQGLARAPSRSRRQPAGGGLRRR